MQTFMPGSSDIVSQIQAQIRVLEDNIEQQREAKDLLDASRELLVLWQGQYGPVRGEDARLLVRAAQCWLDYQGHGMEQIITTGVTQVQALKEQLKQFTAQIIVPNLKMRGN